MKKILLTGASGSIGFETFKQLLNTDYEVTAFDVFSKSSKKKLNKYKDKAKIVYGDVRDKKLIEGIIKDKDVVIHLAALIPPQADKFPKLTHDINYGGTKNIIDAIKKVNPDCFLIFSSSVSTYGDRVKDFWIKVTDALKPSEKDYYAEVKIITEELIKKSEINYSIFRFTAIMNRPQIDPLMFHMPLETKLEIATVYDTARALVKAIEHTEELNHNIYNLSGGEKCRTTYREFLSNMFKIYGLQFKYLKNNAFAEHNFHCGYFLDSDDLENILHFREDTLEDYYKIVNEDTKGIVRFFSRMMSKPIIFFLNKKSDPLQAIKNKNKELIKRFFKK